MQTKFFCDLYVSEGWEKKKLKLIKKLQKNKSTKSRKNKYSKIY